MNWENLFQNLGIFALISTTVGYLIQSSIKLLFDRNVQQLKMKANLEIEKYKAEIQLESEKNKVQYSLLQTKRAEVVECLYEKLNKMDAAIKSYINIFQGAGDMPVEEKGKIAVKNGNEFIDYYFSHKIYFDKETCKLIEDINKRFRTAWIDFQYKDSVPKEKVGYDLWLKAWKSVDEEIPILRERVEDSFRKLLGVNL